MSEENKISALKQKIALVASKNKKLEEALSQHKAEPERGDVYLFKLENVPEDVGVFWVVINRHPDDPELIFAVPADTNTLIGSFDVPIPESALFGPLSLRLGRGLWLMETIFEPSQRVGMIETLFMDRAQFIMSRIARCEWVSSEIQQATDANPDYEEWIEMLDQAYVAMRTYRASLVFDQVREEVPVKAAWFFDNIMDSGKVKETLFEYLVAPFFPSPSFQYKVSRMDETRGSATEEGSKKSNRYNVGESFGFRVGMLRDGYLTIFHYSEDGNIDLQFPVLPEDESYLSGGSKKVFDYDVKEPFGKHFLRAIWTAKPLIDLESVDPSSETEKKNIGMKFIDRLAQMGKDDIQQVVYEYEVVEE